MPHIAVPLASAPGSIKFARDATQRWLRDIDRAVDEGPAAVVVSELVTNSVLHAQAPIVLHLWDQEVDCVRIGVADGSTTVACNEPVQPGARSGRGLHLVEGLACGWGSEVHDGGKLTWADLPSAL